MHALKSNSKGIGANEVSELALGLEMAGKENRIEYIMEHHSQLMERHDALLDALASNTFIHPESNGESEAQETGGHDFEELLAALKEKLDGFESEGLDRILDELAQCHMPDTDVSLADLVEGIRDKVNDFDFLVALEQLGLWEEERKG